VTKGRLEAFSDGVIAIIITIMVLELRPPATSALHDLGELVPDLLAYVLSFVFLGIYWNNHHHMLHASSRVSGTVLWANLHLLFWLSLVPFVTAWMGHHPGKAIPIAAYAVVMVLAGVAYTILERTLISAHGPDSRLRRAVGNDTKGLISIAAYLVAIPAAFVVPALSYGAFVVVALLWLVPDRRIERELRDEPPHRSDQHA
jgi:uncharacterized membrane protein